MSMSMLEQVGRSESDTADDYWISAQRPLASLAFLMPLLLAYEFGVVFLGSANVNSLRNGADYWMRAWLSTAGVTQGFVLPVLLIAVLLCWHIACKYPWRVRGHVIAGMCAESLLFAFSLVAIARIHDIAYLQLSADSTLSITTNIAATRAITFLGAGVYEEVLFRLLLLPSCYALFRVCRMPRRISAVAAVICTSIIFAFAHYVGSGADEFTMFSFSFRALAGVFFAGLFLMRGFGITVGAHAAYDLLVGVLLAQS